jgi:hypothetical protein
MEDNLNFFKMEDDLDFLSNGRRPLFFSLKWKTTLTLYQMEDDLYFFSLKWKTTSTFPMRYNLNFFYKEDDLNFSIGR